MPTYLYLLLPTGSEPPPLALRGLADAPVRALQAPGLVAWVSTLDRVPAPGVAAAREHDRVAAGALATGVTPLPARFGQRYEDDDRCIADIAARSAALAAALGRVAGTVEMIVGATLAPGAEDSTATRAALPGSGRAHMERLRARANMERILRNRARVVADAVRSVVPDLIRAEELTVRHSPRPVMSVSHLVARDDVSAYRVRLAASVIGGITGALAIGGPTAPYSFATLTDG